MVRFDLLIVCDRVRCLPIRRGFVASTVCGGSALDYLVIRGYLGGGSGGPEGCLPPPPGGLPGSGLSSSTAGAFVGSGLSFSDREGCERYLSLPPQSPLVRGGGGQCFSSSHTGRGGIGVVDR